MYRTSKETQYRKDEKRRLIMDTAAIVFAEQGYHNTTVKDVVDRAKVSVGSFYFYFKGKEELFGELYDDISKEFDEKTMMVLDTKNFSLAKNFTRAIVANLWMYQNRSELIKLMLIEAPGLNPEFQKRRWESIRVSCGSMEKWFQLFKANHPVNIPDERAAALAFNGTFYYVIIDWVEGDRKEALTDSAYALSVFNLQAIGASYQNEDIGGYVKELLEELNP